jgi:hypothetical protein
MTMNVTVDKRIANAEVWHLMPPKDINMRIPDDFKKCVTFIGFETDGGYQFCGTGFFIGMRPAKATAFIFVYLVTAKHVAVQLAGREFVLRVNKKDGTSQIMKGPADFKWHYHPDDAMASDVAVCQFQAPPEFQNQMDLGGVPVECLATDEQIKTNGIGDGDNIVVIGLFAHHQGNVKNLPIIRSGNIAMMPDEPIKSHDFGDMEAYLIECRSIGGLSGSPVFVIKDIGPGQARIFLLGLIHGHWDVEPDDVIDTSTAEKNSVNVGVAIVAPAKRILETLNHQELKDVRSRMEREWLERYPPTLDKK